jgi:hypothetical protein
MSGQMKRHYVASMLAMVAACAASFAIASPPASSSGAGLSSNAPQVSSTTVDELHSMIESHQLAELRTTYNGSYGASLLFQADKVSYYVALFHGKEFWRVIETSSYDDAENVYHTFAGQTQQLAQVDIDTIRLQASKKFTEHLVEVNEQHLQTLQQDMNNQQQQARQVAAQQQQSQQQAASLTTDLQTTNDQLSSVKQRIHALEVQQTNPTMTLPTPEEKTVVSTPTPASGAASASASLSH